MKRKLLFLLAALLTSVGMWADVVPTASTPSAGNTYYLYNPKTKSFLFSDGNATPYVRSMGNPWTVETSDMEGYVKIRLKNDATGYFWGKYWAIIGANYSEYLQETYFRIDKVAETDNDYHLYANAWGSTSGAYVYVNTDNRNRVACNANEQGSLDTGYTIWQFVTEDDYATYCKNANLPYLFSELFCDYTAQGATPTGGHTYVLYNETGRFLYDSANTPKVSSSKATYFTLENTASEFYIRSNAGLLVKSGGNDWTTTTNGGYGDDAKWAFAQISGGKYTIHNHQNASGVYFAPNANGEDETCYRDKTALTGWYCIDVTNKNVPLFLLYALQQAKDTYYTPAPAGEAKDNLLIALNDVYVNYVIVSNFTSDIYDAGVQAINDAVLAAIKSQTESGGSLTYLLSNPSFETDNAAANLTTGNTAPTGWSFSGNTTNSQWGTANASTTIQGIGTTFSPSDGDKYYYIRSNWQTNQDYTLSKTIKGLPAGVYRVSSKIARYLSQATTTYTLSLQEAGKTESKTITNANDPNWRPWQVFVKKLEDGTDLTIKANMRFDHAASGNHYQMLLDNFEFEYLGADDEENYDFAAGAIPNGNEIKGYIHDISAENMTSGMEYVPGWELAVDNGDTRAGGVMNINSGSKLNGSTVPSKGYDGNSNGKVLGLNAVWSGTVQYKKNVQLNAGVYRISFPIYNVAGTTAINKNLFGFIENDGTEHLATETTFNTGEWTLMTVEFNLESDTEGYISLGYIAASTGNANMPHLFVDRVMDASAMMAVNSTAKWGTFCAPFDVTIPSGVTAYTCSGESDGVLTLDEVTGGTIYANTPVILNAESGLASTTFYGVREGSSDIVNEGLLYGNVSASVQNVPGDGTAYLLQLINDKVGFYKVSASDYKIGINRCYLISEGASLAREALFLDGEGETAINEIEAVEAKAEGLKDGKYLINGRIVIVKDGKTLSISGQILK